MPTPGLLGYDSSMPTHYGLYFSSEVTLLYIVHIHISAVNTDVAHALGNLSLSFGENAKQAVPRILGEKYLRAKRRSKFTLTVPIDNL